MVRWTSRTWGLQRGSMASMKRPRSRMPHWRCKASLPMWRWVFGNGHSLYPIAYGTYGLEARGKTWKTNNEPSKWKWTSSIWKFKTSFWRSWTTIFRNGECCSTYIFRIPIDRYWFFLCLLNPTLWKTNVASWKLHCWHWRDEVTCRLVLRVYVSTTVLILIS